MFSQTLGLGVSVVLLLSACDKPADKDHLPTPRPVQQSIERLPVEVPVKVGLSTEEEANKRREQLRKQLAKKKKKPEKPLNLQLPNSSMPLAVDGMAEVEALLGEEAGRAAERENVLPNLFEQKSARAKVGGSVIRDPENENYLDSLQGAEVNVEIEID